MLPEPGAPATSRPASGTIGLKQLLALTSTIGALLIILLIHLLVWQRTVALRGGIDAQAVQSDFSATLTGALVIRQGQGAQLYDLASQRAAQSTILDLPDTTQSDTVLPYIHPPFEALLVAPLLALSYGTLYLLWNALSLLAFVAALLLLARTTPLPWAVGLVALAALGSFSPVHQGLILGQSSPLILLGLCGAYAALRQRRDTLAGVALALVVLKPQLLLVVGLLLLLQRRWRTLIVCGGIIALASVAAMAVLGPLWPLRYARFLASISQWGGSHNEYPQIMYNWRGLLVNLLGSTDSAAIGPLVGLLMLATLGALVWAWWRSRAATGDDADRANELLWALAVPAAILIAPHLYIHDLTLLALSAWLVLHQIAAGVWRGRQRYAWYALLWVGYFLAFSSLFRSDDRAYSPVIPGILCIAVLIGLLTWRADGIVAPHSSQEAR